MSAKFYEKFEKKAKSKDNKKDKRKKNNSIALPAVNNNDVKDNKPAPAKKECKHALWEYDKTATLFNKDRLSEETDYILQHFDEIVQGVRPLNSKQLQLLPDNIKELSHQLTDKRSERRLGYMNNTVQLSSYVRYYTWWNLVRLTRLFSNLPSSSFPRTDCVCIDLGTGPLTVITALWLARPELRKLKLTWYCLDVSSNSMVLGEDIYMSIAARTMDNDRACDPWNIIRVKGSFGTAIKQKADFITCANMFNELDQAGDMPPEYQSKKYFQQLKAYGTESCKYLLVEPGVPKATRTLTLLRERFISAGKAIAAPCPHNISCPMNGFKAYTGSIHKWCNFCFSTEDAPAKLLRLSEQAKLPKERATLIFISAINNNKKETLPESNKKPLMCRITSDPFRLPDYKVGYYGCSELGLTLIKTKGTINRNPKCKQNGVISNEKAFIIKGPFTSGDLIKVNVSQDFSLLETDEKSGAAIIEL